jgi:alkanesulfonate monooxygenase SsuD/methylene tetrahydromethanopterin reductase-like flavin-dependent oxidoreductase (luciferase family)
VDISINIPTFMQTRTRDEELAWYRKVDEGPWASLSSWERVTYPGWALTVQLAAAAAITERVRLWTDIVTLPLRSAVLFAKEVASVDVLSGGRLTLSVGIGAHDEDFLAVGSDLGQRRQKMDEQVATMRRIWAQEPAVEGHLPIGPAPLQPGGVPLIAGVKGPKALARAARWADGVSDPTQTMYYDAEYLAAQRERVVQAWQHAGRKEKPHFSTTMWFALGPNPKEQLGKALWDYVRVWGEDAARTHVEKSWNYGRAGLLEAVDGARAAGLDELRLIPSTPDLAELDRARDVLGI